jgi:Chlorite dismutase
MTDRMFSFIGGSDGPWRVERVAPVKGESLARPARVRIDIGLAPDSPANTIWTLRGVTSNQRYTTREENKKLVAAQPGLNRPEASCAVLIPIRKTTEWWALPQNDRRAIFERQSKHIEIGLRYLPAIARKLHHCRDLGEPFDFLAWFEYAPTHASAFDELLHALRTSPEWTYADREVDIRLVRGVA